MSYEYMWNEMLNWLMTSEELKVPTDFHARCGCLNSFLENDTTGLVNTIVDYSINSASEAVYKIESKNSTLTDFLNTWLTTINRAIEETIKEFPTGIEGLSKEYFKERWQGSSLCLLRVSDWQPMTVGTLTLDVPTRLWFANGGSIKIDGNAKNIKPGKYQYYLTKEAKNSLPLKDEQVVIQKPFDRWFVKYPTPYLFRKGVYKNAKAMQILQEKGEEVVQKILPYLFMIKKGDKDLVIADKQEVTDADLTALVEGFKEKAEEYKRQGKKVPIWGVPFDTQAEHLIPDFRRIISEELFRQGYRTILSGLGFVDVIQGISSTRQESVLNPKPFIAEVNSGVKDFKSLLLEVLQLIIDKNKEAHPKALSDNNDIKVVNSPLRINVDIILDKIRTAYIYGIVSKTSYQEMLGLDPTTELERRKLEAAQGLDDIFYPQIIQNQEQYPNDKKTPPVTEKQVEKDEEKTNMPEHMQEEASEIITAPYDTLEDLPAAVQKLPKAAQRIWKDVFNESYAAHKDEARAFGAAWTAANNWLEKHNYEKNDNGKWVKRK